MTAAPAPAAAGDAATRPTAAVVNGRVDHASFDAILRSHVHDGLIDYVSLKRRDYQNLLAYLSRLEQIDPAALSDGERLAMYCNLYNATMIRVVVDRLHAGYSVAENDKHIFREPLVRLRAGVTSLNHLEHELIRKGYPGEYRIHASLVCAGLGCPKIAPRALRGDGLDAMLDDDMRRWVNDPSRNTIDRAAGTATLSKLFKFYADDFGGIDKVVPVLDRYTDADLSKTQVTFAETYDWSLNIAQPTEGQWVKVASPHARITPWPQEGRDSLVDKDALLEAGEQRMGMTRVKPIADSGVKNWWISTEDVAPYIAAEHKWQPEKKQ
ncbi:MAG TPA: DUF547 domain-containing protein [Tepidisphaeraceae bacterium]